MTVRLPPSSPNASSEVFTIDFREMAPAFAHERMYVDDPVLARWGGLAVGVPGELRGLKKAHDMWGTLPWKELVQPSVELAKGWRVQKELERRIEVCRSPRSSYSLNARSFADPLADVRARYAQLS